MIYFSNLPFRKCEMQNSVQKNAHSDTFPKCVKFVNYPVSVYMCIQFQM